MAGDIRPFGELFAGATRNGLTRPRAARGAGVKMVNMGELFAHPRLCNAPMDRVPLTESEAERFLLSEGDLLFARQSLVLEGAGKCSIFLKDDEPVTFESHVTRVRLDPNKADPRFYFYYLQSHHGRAAIRSIVEQAQARRESVEAISKRSMSNGARFPNNAPSPASSAPWMTRSI
jgi:type I restriction enzyme, S subunit